MSISQNDSTHHTLHNLDVELDKLYEMLLDITDLLIKQLELLIQIFEKTDAQLIAELINIAKEIQEIGSNIDTGLVEIVARFNPVANDLRDIITVSKLANHYQKICGCLMDSEISINSLFESSSDTQQSVLLDESIEICNYMLSLLKKLRAAIANNDLNLLFDILELNRSYEIELNNKIKDDLLVDIQTNKDYGNAVKAIVALDLSDFFQGEIRYMTSQIIADFISDCEYRYRWISETAYFLAEHRNFIPGFELSDWLSAEQEFQTKLVLRYKSFKKTLMHLKVI